MRHDLTNQVFGSLVVEGYSHTGNKGRAYWSCRCVCGRECVVRAYQLKSGGTRSCGCHKAAVSSARARTHGMSDTAQYAVWRSMVQRCTNTRHRYYHHYGGRGITVCESWLKFEGFYNDMGDRPSDKHSIDRIDNNGPYCKENCRWATQEQQMNNTRCNKTLTHEGETLSLAEWSRRSGVSRSTLQHRLKRGWLLADALVPTKPREYTDDSSC